MLAIKDPVDPPPMATWCRTRSGACSQRESYARSQQGLPLGAFNPGITMAVYCLSLEYGRSG